MPLFYQEIKYKQNCFTTTFDSLLEFQHPFVVIHWWFVGFSCQYQQFEEFLLCGLLMEGQSTNCGLHVLLVVCNLMHTLILVLANTKYTEKFA